MSAKISAKLRLSILTIIVFVCVLSLASALYSQQVAQEEFIYDAEGKRDPFIPLLDKTSSSGLRATFIPPRLKVRLPVDIKVKGILRKDNEYFAIINDKVMKKGQNIGEIRIKEIEKDKVILEYGEKEFTAYLRKEKAK